MAKDENNAGLPVEALRWIATIKDKPKTVEEYDARVLEALEKAEAWNIPATKPYMALVLGVHVDGVDQWPIGQGWPDEERERWTASRKKMLTMLEAATTIRASQGRIGDIFLSKAAFGYSDQGPSRLEAPATISIQLVTAQPQVVDVPDVQATLIKG